MPWVLRLWFFLGFWVYGFIAEARKLEHHWPHALTVKYRESQHESS